MVLRKPRQIALLKAIAYTPISVNLRRTKTNVMFKIPVSRSTRVGILRLSVIVYTPYRAFVLKPEAVRMRAISESHTMSGV